MRQQSELDAFGRDKCGSRVSYKMRERILVALICLPVSACGQRKMIPTAELNEIRPLAFDCATKRYVLSDASIESESQAIKNKPAVMPQEDQRDAYGKLTRRYINALFNAVVKQRAGLVPVVASVKGRCLAFTVEFRDPCPVWIAVHILCAQFTKFVEFKLCRQQPMLRQHKSYTARIASNPASAPLLGHIRGRPAPARRVKHQTAGVSSH